MGKKIINIGDVFVTKMCNLYCLDLEDVYRINQIDESILESDKYLHKSIFINQISGVSEVSSPGGKMYNCPIFIKYIGEGKFVEMETGTIIFGDPRIDMGEYVFSGKFISNQIYESYKNLNDDILYIKENPLILYGKNGDEIIKPISEYDKIKYLTKTQDNLNRIDTLEKLKAAALEQFNKSIERQVVVDHEMAILENRIKIFSKTK